MSMETKLGTVLGLAIVVMLAVVNATPKTPLRTDPTTPVSGTPPRISLATPE